MNMFVKVRNWVTTRATLPGREDKGMIKLIWETIVKQYGGQPNAVQYGHTAGWKCKYQKPYEKSIGDKIDETSSSIGDTISSWFKDEDD